LSANIASDANLDGHLIPGLKPAGVPRNLGGLMYPFHYNALDELEDIVSRTRGELAAVVMEPVRDNPPAQGFLSGVRAMAKEAGAALIFDEVTAGFRMNTGGIHMTLSVEPDLAVFAKALGNGVPMSAVIGRGRIMEAAQDTFISSTTWTERLGPAAALAVLKKHREKDVPAHLIAMGEKVKKVWTEMAAKHGLKIHVSGIAPLGHFGFDYPNAQAMRTLYTQLMLERGVLATGAYYAMYAHTDAHLTKFRKAADESFALVAQAAADNKVEAALKGPVAHSGFKRLT
jgi:glutamate-1-semialdehyde 2,1-aminomutase